MPEGPHHQPREHDLTAKERSTGKTLPAAPFDDGPSHLGRNKRQNEPRLVKLVGSGRLLPVAGGSDERAAAIATVQRGRASHAQLLEAGLTRHMIARMLKAGRLRREYRGVYVVGHSAPIPLGRETAALLAIGANAVLSGETAGELWGVKRPPHRGECVEMIVIGAKRTRSRDGILAHRSDLITPQDVRNRAGLPVTSPEWTLLDLAARGTPRDAERAVDELLAQRLTSLTKLAQLLARTTGHKGHCLLAELVAHHGRSTITRSEAEERMLAMIRAAELPPPELNARVCGYEVDFYWPEQRVAVEVDGYRWHSGASAFERDRRKGNALTGAGIDLLRVTWQQMDREALALIAGLARTLALRTPSSDREQPADQGSARSG